MLKTYNEKTKKQKNVDSREETITRVKKISAELNIIDT